METNIIVDASKLMDLTKFERICEISRGSSSTAIKYQKKGSQEMYCIKLFHKTFSSVNDQQKFFKEVANLSKINNPAVISLYGFNVLCPGINKPIIITKYYPTTVAQCIIESYDVPFCNKIHEIPFSKKYIIVLGIAEGMKYLHSINLVHRDLKSANILLDEEYKPVICDLGLSRTVAPDMNSGVGSVMYMPPEILNGKNYTKSVDVYSYAILFYEIFVWGPPYPDESESFHLLNSVKNGLRPEINEISNEVIQNFLKDCWNQEPENRPTFEDIVRRIKSKEFRDAMQANDSEVNEYLSIFNDSLHNEEEIKVDHNSITFIKQKADEGNIDMIIRYADIMLTGDGVPEPNQEEAINYYKIAADRENSYAMNQYARILIKKYNDDEHIDEAIDYFKKAIRSGNFSAMHEFIYYDFDKGNFNKLAELFKFCADNENVEAMIIYANMLYDGDAIKQDKQMAFQYFRNAADHGNIDAIRRVAFMLQEGDGIEVNNNEAAIYFQQGIAQNDAESILYYALSILNGDYSELNSNEVTNFIMRAADLGNLNAMLCYATILRNGYLEARCNIPLANEYIRRVETTCSEKDAKLIFNFASIIFKGKIKNFKKKDAILFLRISAEKGDVDGM